MTSDTFDVADLVQHFERIEKQRMHGLPIANSNLHVEAVGPRRFEDHKLLVLISSWFMNIVLLPGNDDWQHCEQGSTCDIGFPADTLTFTVCQDDVLGTYLTAVMFRTVSDFPDQKTARAIANELLQQLFSETARNAAARKTVMSRRTLLTGAGVD